MSDGIAACSDRSGPPKRRKRRSRERFRINDVAATTTKSFVHRHTFEYILTSTGAAESMLSRDHNRDWSGHSRWKTLLNEFVPWNPGQSLVPTDIFVSRWFSKISSRWKELAFTLEGASCCCSFLWQRLMKSSLKGDEKIACHSYSIYSVTLCRLFLLEERNLANESLASGQTRKNFYHKRLLLHWCNIFVKEHERRGSLESTLMILEV